MNSKRIITYAANSVNLILLGMAGNQCRAVLFCIYKSKSASHLIFSNWIEWNKLVDSFDSIWYNKGRKGWRFWYGFFPSVRAKGIKSRQPCARWMAAYFYFLEPKLRPSSIATNTKEIIMQNREIISKSDMTFTSYAFVEHQRWRSQAPSYSFLPIESMK